MPKESSWCKSPKQQRRRYNVDQSVPKKKLAGIGPDSSSIALSSLLSTSLCKTNSLKIYTLCSMVIRRHIQIIPAAPEKKKNHAQPIRLSKLLLGSGFITPRVRPSSGRE